jgi:hypothetical protein
MTPPTNDVAADEPDPEPGGAAADDPEGNLEGTDFLELLGPGWDAPSPPARDSAEEPKPDVLLDEVIAEDAGGSPIADDARLVGGR